MLYYEEKVEYLVNHYGPICPIAYEKKGRTDRVGELHHMLHNTKVNRKRFPLFINSLINLRPVSSVYHKLWPSWGKISDLQAMKYEKFLQKHKRICKFVNTVQ